MRAALGNGLPNAAHAQNAQCAAMYVRAGKHVVTPAVPQTGAQKSLAFGHAPGGGHEQCEAKIGGGLGQHVGRVGRLDAGGGHRLQVKIVVAHRHVGANFQVRAGRQQCRVNALAAGGEHTLFALQLVNQLRGCPKRVVLVGSDLKMRLKQRQNLRKNSARDQDGRLHKRINGQTGAFPRCRRMHLQNSPSAPTG